MNTVAFVLMVLAFAVFVLGRGYRSTDTRTVPGWYNSTDLGLALLTAGLIVEFAAKSHTFHF
jgi:hypothetical protein